MASAVLNVLPQQSKVFFMQADSVLKRVRVSFGIVEVRIKVLDMAKAVTAQSQGIRTETAQTEKKQRNKTRNMVKITCLDDLPQPIVSDIKGTFSHEWFPWISIGNTHFHERSSMHNWAI